MLLASKQANELDAQACTRPADTVTSGGLFSWNSSIDATKNAAFYFKKVFAQSDATLRGVSLFIQQCHKSLCPDIMEFFSAFNIFWYILRYPSAVSCGSDSIHGHILKVMLPTKMDEVLSFLFIICIMSGIPLCQ
ncbi:hypothetical protein DSO57_1006866 [Entomophthora muscae]|uniref:Uncharacterized protein n=1 Tax=Entomophthora muscae TaxID=34485 RepID=A0ACC2SK71_9FUNG|nr:hypothetical protein DSO57_1006866 [Entomophthora muscae]